MARFGFIGMGNMGFAMLSGAKEVYGTKELLFSCKRMERKEEVKEKTGILFCKDNKELAEQAEYIVLAVKPQVYPEVLEEIKETVNSQQIVISIAPGITTESVKESLGGKVRVVRAMPNTPALVKEAMSGVCFSEDTYTEEEKNTVIDFFNSFGVCQVVPEKLMNAVVCASGSSPAYVYLFIEALADSAVKYGIPRTQAYTFAAQTVLGAAKMVLETGLHPGVLKDQVCSPGGTTIQAVAALEEEGFRNAVLKAGDACYEKTVSIK
ncbi:MAG: pyrroline-5-carboxylate reductase [Clostridiales bacterium]|nr:pyrroline-5-carboxylate reductase [Clostridiales bacterium]